MIIEAEPRRFLPEVSSKELTYGIVLTGGAQMKRTPDFAHPSIGKGEKCTYPWKYRIEPDLEGKIRALAALHDLLTSKIDRILVVGGSKVENVPQKKQSYISLAQIYASYLRRFARIYNFNPRLIQYLKGGINTSTDLNKAENFLKKRRKNTQSRVYSTSYHLRRKAVRRFKNNPSIPVYLEQAELKIVQRHKRPMMVKILDRILTKEHLDEMRRISFASEFLPSLFWNPAVYVLRDERVVKLEKRAKKLFTKK